MNTQYKLTESNLHKLREEYFRGFDSGIAYSDNKKLNVNPIFMTAVELSSLYPDTIELEPESEVAPTIASKEPVVVVEKVYCDNVCPQLIEENKNNKKVVILNF